MKTNLVNLMSIVSEEEKKFNNYFSVLKSHAYNLSIQELDGTVNVTDDYADDFKNEFEDYKSIQKNITKLKAVIYQKNNDFKLSDGRTIQEAIVDNTNLRKMKVLYESLLSMRNTKQRITEVHNSYFECKNVNFDIPTLKKEYEEIDNKIKETDFEISKLNSIEFDIEL